MKKLKKKKNKKSRAQRKKKNELVQNVDTLKELIQEVDNGTRTMASAAKSRLGFIISRDRN